MKINTAVVSPWWSLFYAVSSSCVFYLPPVPWRQFSELGAWRKPHAILICVWLSSVSFLFSGNFSGPEFSDAQKAADLRFNLALYGNVREGTAISEYWIFVLLECNFFRGGGGGGRVYSRLSKMEISGNGIFLTLFYWSGSTLLGEQLRL
jgi:hypothetical protein